MSTVVITAFAIFRRVPDSSDVELFHGASDVSVNGSNELELVLASAPIDDSLTPPKGALLALYGFKDRTDELQKRRREAATLGANFQSMEIEVEVGYIESNIMDREKLKDARFANVGRMSTVLQMEIIEKFKSYAKESRSKKLPADMDRLSTIGSRPDLWARLLDDDADFRNIELLILPVLEEGSVRMVALLRPNFKYVNIVQNNDGEILVLPKGFGKKINA